MLRDAAHRHALGKAQAQSIKQARRVSDLSPASLESLRSRGAIPIDTKHGVIAVGVIFRTSDEFLPWLENF